MTSLLALYKVSSGTFSGGLLLKVQGVVSNHWTGLVDWIEGLDCELDCWTGLLDWITGLD